MKQQRKIIKFSSLLIISLFSLNASANYQTCHIYNNSCQQIGSLLINEQTNDALVQTTAQLQNYGKTQKSNQNINLSEYSTSAKFLLNNQNAKPTNLNISIWARKQPNELAAPLLVGKGVWLYNSVNPPSNKGCPQGIYQQATLKFQRWDKILYSADRLLTLFLYTMRQVFSLANLYHLVQVSLFISEFL